jgi:hypothetical protein
MPQWYRDASGTTLTGCRARYTIGMVEPGAIPPDPVIEVFKKDVDRTLLRENLRLTPEQRLQKLQSAVRGILALREARKTGS